MHKTARSLLFPVLIISSSLIVGCGASVPVVKPFKLEIQQGNVVTSKMLLQLRPGMTKSQVKFIMGTPLIIDSFHSARWDYFYQLRQSGKIVEQRRVILDFEKDLLARVRGDVVPQGTAGAETGAVTLADESNQAKVAPEKKEGLLENLKFWRSNEPKDVAPKESLPAAPAKENVPQTDLTHDAPVNLVAPMVDTPSAVVPDVEAETQPMFVSPPLITPAESFPITVDEAPLPVEKAAEPAETNQPIPATPTPVEEMSHDEVPSKTLPLAPNAPVERGDRLIFRLDRNLNMQNVQPDNAAEEAVKALPQALEKPSVEDKKPLQADSEPGYFEKMLEKIGF